MNLFNGRLNRSNPATIACGLLSAQGVATDPRRVAQLEQFCDELVLSDEYKAYLASLSQVRRALDSFEPFVES